MIQCQTKLKSGRELQESPHKGLCGEKKGGGGLCRGEGYVERRSQTVKLRQICLMKANEPELGGRGLYKRRARERRVFSPSR